MDAGAPGERSNQHGEPRRSLEGLDCLGMLPATPANMPPACGTWRRPSVGNRQCAGPEIGSASCRERVCQSVSISVVAVSLTKKSPLYISLTSSFTFTRLYIHEY